MRVVLVYDDREKIDCISALEECIKSAASKPEDYVIRKARLEVGDYKILIEIGTDDPISMCIAAYERKTLVDLRTSFLSGRLQSQLQSLKDARASKEIRSAYIILEYSAPNDIKNYKEGHPSYAAIEELKWYWENSMRVYPLCTIDANATGRLLFFHMKHYLSQASKVANNPKVVKETVDNTAAKIKAEETKIITKAKAHHIVKEDWSYLHMYISMFEGVSQARAVDISKKFKHSMRYTVHLAVTDKALFISIIQDKDNTNYKRAVPMSTAEKLHRILSSGAL